MLKRFKLVKRGLQAMVISNEWASYREDDTVKANSVKEKILDDDWWDKVSYILSFTEPIYDMIRVCDTDKPCLHLVYEMWDLMIEKLKAEIYKKEKRPLSTRSIFYDVVHQVLVVRWTKNNTPLHCLAQSLNPRYYSDAWLLADSKRLPPHRDGEISQERKTCFKRLFPNDDEHDRVLDEYALFSMKAGPFEYLTCITKMDTMEPKSWWANFGAQTPLLQTLALNYLDNLVRLHVLSEIGAPMHLSTRRRNRLTTSRAQDLVYIHNNLRILSRAPNDVVNMWDVGGDAFDSMEDVGFLEFADLS
ncbi:putative ribonuclease H-like superfamily [Helianthus annuus]|nr:putative ribonuclease H-like superfamily [Helianthus annuus]